MKKKMIALCICGLLLSTTLGVFGAGDYGNKPNYPEPTPPLVVPTTSPAPGAGNTNATPPKNEEDIAKDIIQGGQDVKTPEGQDAKLVTVTGDAKLTPQMLAEAIKSDKPVYFMNNDQNIAVRFVTNKATTETMRDLSTGFIVIPAPVTTIPEEAFHVTLKDIVDPVADRSIFVIPNEKGSFGVTMRVSIKSSFEEGTDTSKNPYLYYLSDDGAIENHGYAVMRDNWITFSISHASSYMISYDKLDVPVNNTSDNYQYNQEVSLVMNEFEAEDEFLDIATPKDEQVKKTMNSTTLVWGVFAVVVLILGAVILKKRMDKK